MPFAIYSRESATSSGRAKYISSKRKFPLRSEGPVWHQREIATGKILVIASFQHLIFLLGINLNGTQQIMNKL